MTEKVSSFRWEYRPRSSLCTHAFHDMNSKKPDIHVLDGWMRATKTPSMHHPRRRNVTTCIGIKEGHIRKTLTKNGELQRKSWECRWRKRKLLEVIVVIFVYIVTEVEGERPRWPRCVLCPICVSASVWCVSRDSKSDSTLLYKDSCAQHHSMSKLQQFPVHSIDCASILSSLLVQIGRMHVCVPSALCSLSSMLPQVKLHAMSCHVIMPCHIMPCAMTYAMPYYMT